MPKAPFVANENDVLIEQLQIRRHSAGCQLLSCLLHLLPPPEPVKDRKPLYFAQGSAVAMDPRHHEYILEVFADQTFVKDIVKGALLLSSTLKQEPALPGWVATLQRTANTSPPIAGVLHTIFFHRYFPPIRPSLFTPTAASSHTSSHSTQSLPITLPAILDPPEISTTIDSHTNLLVSQLTPQSSASPSSAAGGSRGEIVVRFFDRKRRKTGITTGWLGRLGGGGQTEEEVCWEEWCVQVIVARPRSEAGKF